MNTGQRAASSALTRPVFSRLEFLKILGVGAVGAAGGQAKPALAAPPSVVEVDVYPTGSFPADLDEVRAAINGGVGPSGVSYIGGGIVHLKATNAAGTPNFFNFGGGASPSGRGGVNVTKDVVILGEIIAPTAMSFPNGEDPGVGFTPDRTVIYGGKQPFQCDYSNPVATTLTVRTIYFAYPSLTAVQVNRSAGLEVSNCVICDVRRDQTAIPGFQVAIGVEATTLSAPNPGNLQGEFRVFNNRIRRALEAPLPPGRTVASSGIILQLARMDAQIFANEIELFEFGGIGIDRNEGAVVVAGNTVRGCGYGPSLSSAGMGARGTSTSVVFERNEIICSDPRVPSERSKNGVFLASSNVAVRSNAIAGVADRYGVWLSRFQPAGSIEYTGSSNLMDRNDLGGLIAGIAQIGADVRCDANRFANNSYGGLALTTPSLAGMVVSSNGNELIDEQFLGNYPGVGASPPVPCVWLRPGSVGNRVMALKYQGSPQGFDVCTQLLDQGSNQIMGERKCAAR